MSQSSPRNDIPAVFKASSAVTGRLTHSIPDELALAVPEYPLFAHARTNRPVDGFIDVTARQFARGVNRASWFLRDLFGEPGNFDTIGYMGPNDLRYFFFMFGAIKVGYKKRCPAQMLFVSPRNHLDGHLHVLEGAECQVFLRAKGTNIEHILKARYMRTATVPELLDMLEETEPVAVYPYTKTFKEACMDPCLVLHTTGSTGLPKPIVWKNINLASYEAWRTIPEVDGYVPTTVVYQQARRAYTSMPLFHTSGLNAGITWSLLCGVTLVYGAPRVVPNAEYVDQVHIHADVDATMGAPSIYEELSRDSDALKRLERMQYVVASGAPLSQAAGRTISQNSRVISNLGSTETSCLQRLSPSIADWDYFYWHPTHSGIEMREYMPGLFELFLVRKQGLEHYQGIFATFPDISEWSMSDLYERHPDPAKPFLYRYKGRKDDVVVLSNGEKVSPALMEAALNSSPLVRGSMVVGRGRFQPAALLDLAIDPPCTIEARNELANDLLPFITAANAHAPAHGQLDRYHILFADSKRPVQYLGQGKIQRLRTYTLYEGDIDKLYRSVEEVGATATSDGGSATSFPLNRKDSVDRWLRELVAEITNLNISDGSLDMFEAGVDSLQIIKMAREVRIAVKRGRLPSSLTHFTPSIIYANPTLDQLTAFILTMASHSIVPELSEKSEPNSKPLLETWRKVDDGGTGSGTLSSSSSTSNSNTEEHDMDIELAKRLVKEYACLLPSLQSRSAPTPESTRGGMTVILTGSTGSLGPYILDELNRNAKVVRIVSLNRSSNAAERHDQLCSERGLAPLLASRVEFLKADLSKPQLGLDHTAYEMLLDTATHIIHNQWPVNFNWPLQSFRPHIHGVVNLIRLAQALRHNALLMFVSSVSAVGSLTIKGTVSEAPVNDINASAPMGYGRSKLVAEMLLDWAARESGVRSVVCRVGIVAGPVGSMGSTGRGVWNKREYIPAMIISSAHLGIFPATFPSRDCIDWIPIDKLAVILVKILETASSSTHTHVLAGQHGMPTTSGSGTQVFHIVNPHTISWHTDLLPIMAVVLPGVRNVEYSEWVAALRASADEAIDPDGGINEERLYRNPAIRLLEFYEGIEAAESKPPRMLSSVKAQEASASLSSIGPVREEWLRIWVRQWGL